MTIKMPTQKDNAQKKGAPNIHTNVPTTNQTNFHLILFFVMCMWFVRSFSYFCFFYHCSHSSYAYERLFCCSLFFRAQIRNHLMVQRVNKRSVNKETIFELIWCVWFNLVFESSASNRNVYGCCWRWLSQSCQTCSFAWKSSSGHINNYTLQNLSLLSCYRHFFQFHSFSVAGSCFFYREYVFFFVVDLFNFIVSIKIKKRSSMLTENQTTNYHQFFGTLWNDTYDFYLEHVFF